MPPYVWSVMDHEKDIPTEQQAPQEEARFPGPHAHADGSQGAAGAAQEGAQAPRGLRSYALPKAARLANRADYQRVYREGSRVAVRFFVFFWRTNRVGMARLGVTATRKIGSAVIRSRCRRYARELFRLNRQMLEGRPLDVVVNVRKGCHQAPWRALQDDFRRGLSEMKRINGRRGTRTG
jgi:ribonuclease P protein component